MPLPPFLAALSRPVLYWARKDVIFLTLKQYKTLKKLRTRRFYETGATKQQMRSWCDYKDDYDFELSFNELGSYQPPLIFRENDETPCWRITGHGENALFKENVFRWTFFVAITSLAVSAVSLLVALLPVLALIL